MMRVRFQFSIKVLLVTLILFASCIALWADRSRRQQRVALSVLSLGGRLVYSNPSIPLPAWLVNSVGHDYFCAIQFVTLYPTDDSDADSQVEVLKDLPFLRSLAIWPCPKTFPMVSMTATPATTSGKFVMRGFAPPPTLPANVPGGITEDGLRFLLENLPHLQHLSLTSSRIKRKSALYLDAGKKIGSFECNTHSSFESQTLP